MKRIGILTAGGDTPALNATIVGAVHRANQFRVEVFGIIKGFSGLLNPEVPHVHLNPLFHADSRARRDPGRVAPGVLARLRRRRRHREHRRGWPTGSASSHIDGLICVGGDGTLNGMQPLCDCLPIVLAPKTIDNDLGLNYLDETNEWIREPDPRRASSTSRSPARTRSASTR